MPDIIFSPETDADLLRIWVDLASFSERAAERILQEIDDAVSSLARFPERGAPRPELGRRLRILIVKRHLVLYRFEQTVDEIHVLRVLEGERDMTDLFRDEIR